MISRNWKGLFPAEAATDGYTTDAASSATPNLDLVLLLQCSPDRWRTYAHAFVPECMAYRLAARPVNTDWALTVTPHCCLRTFALEVGCGTD